MHNCITSEWYSQSERSETANDDFYLYMKLIETYWKCPTLRMLPPASERCNRGHNRGFTGVIRGFQTNRHFPPQKYSHTAIYVIIKLLYIDFKCQLKGLKNPPQVNLSFTVKNLSSRRLKTNNYANDERSMLMLLRHSSLADLNKTIRNHPLKVKLHGMALLADELPTEIVAVVSSEHGKNIDIMWYQYVNMISFYMNLRWACNFLKSRAYLPSRQINTKSPLHSLWPLDGGSVVAARMSPWRDHIPYTDDELLIVMNPNPLYPKLLAQTECYLGLLPNIGTPFPLQMQTVAHCNPSLICFEENII